MDVSSLVQGLQAEELQSRVEAAEALSQLGEEAQPAAPALARATGDVSEEVREYAVSALEDLGPPDPAQIAEIVEQLQDTCEDVAYWAATLLGRSGESAGLAAEPLAQALDAERPLAVRQRAAWALGRLGSAAARAEQQLRAASLSDNPRLAQLARQALDQSSS